MAKPKKPVKPKRPKVEKPTAETPPTDKKPATRREATQNPGAGHNIAELRALAEPHMEKLFALQADMDSDMAGYRKDFKEAYEDAANSSGIKKSIFIKEFKRALRNKREQEKERMMDAQERDAAESLRAAFDGTPMGDWFAGAIAVPNEVTKEEAAESQAEEEGAE